MTARERLEELLADQALFGLEAGEASELEQLLADLGTEGAHDFEQAAAALDLAMGPTDFEPMPAALSARLSVAAEAFTAGAAATPEAPVSATPAPPAPAPAPSSTTARGPSPAWWLAAAAAVIALVGWWPRLASTPAEVTPGPAELRDALIASAEVLQRDWTGTELAPEATGDVVWSQAGQDGYMRIAGLPANDPTESQYQLWIFDAEQEHPVDGGVFDVGPDGEVIVPIDAKLGVATPTLFAVTVEKPGGVVVSDRERIALVAEV